MKKKDIILFGVATGIIVVLNFLMVTVVQEPGQTSSLPNYFVIAVALFMFHLMKRYGSEVDKRQIRPERYGIWGLAAATLIWFINRVDPTYIPDDGKLLLALGIVGLGTFFVTVTIVRNKKRGKEQ